VRVAFTVVFLRRAQREIADNMAWLESTLGLRAADRWRIGLLTGVISALGTDPQRYPQADEAVDLGVDLRELLHGRRRQVYRVLFTIDGETVYIHRDRHTTQDRLQPGDL
jgi:plasmid stabilization system protein ParE